jgi:hypothetical protein
LSKVGELCEVMEIHPLTLLALAYAGGEKGGVDKLLARVQRELAEIASAMEIHWETAAHEASVISN